MMEIPSFEQRLAAVLTMLGLNRVEELLEFLVTGNYESLPAPIARRLRRIERASAMRKTGETD